MINQIILRPPFLFEQGAWGVILKVNLGNNLLWLCKEMSFLSVVAKPCCLVTGVGGIEETCQ